MSLVLKGNIVRSKRRRKPGHCIYALVDRKKPYPNHYTPNQLWGIAITYPDGKYDSRKILYGLREENIELVPHIDLPHWVSSYIADIKKTFGADQWLDALSNKSITPNFTADNEIINNTDIEEEVAVDEFVEEEKEAALRTTTGTIADWDKARLRMATFKYGLTPSQSSTMSKEDLVNFLKDKDYRPPRAFTYQKRSVGRKRMEEAIVELGWPPAGISSLSINQLRAIIRDDKKFFIGMDNLVAIALKAALDVTEAGSKGLQVSVSMLQNMEKTYERELSVLRTDKQALQKQVDSIITERGTFLTNMVEKNGKIQQLQQSLKDLIPKTSENLKALELGKALLERNKIIQDSEDEQLDRFLILGAREKRE